MKSILCSIFIAAMLSACAVTPSKEAAQVRDADEKTVASCQFLRDFDGTSGWGGLAQGAGIENARTEVREKAAKIGATHLLWTGVTGGYGATTAAHAYKCG